MIQNERKLSCSTTTLDKITLTCTIVAHMIHCTESHYEHRM